MSKTLGVPKVAVPPAVTVTVRPAETVTLLTAVVAKVGVEAAVKLAFVPETHAEVNGPLAEPDHLLAVQVLDAPLVSQNKSAGLTSRPNMTIIANRT